MSVSGFRDMALILFIRQRPTKHEPYHILQACIWNMYSSATKFSSDSIAHGQCGPPAIPSDSIASISSSWPAAGNSVNSSWPATESLWPASQHLQCTFHLFYKTGMTSKPSAFPASANKVCVNNHSSAIQSLRPASHRLQYIVCIILSLFLWPAILRYCFNIYDQRSFACRKTCVQSQIC